MTPVQRAYYSVNTAFRVHVCEVAQGLRNPDPVYGMVASINEMIRAEFFDTRYRHLMKRGFWEKVRGKVIFFPTRQYI